MTGQSLFSILVMTAVCSSGCRESRQTADSQVRSGGVQSQENKQEDDKSAYLKMFADNIVPSYPKFDEPEAPRPVIYFLADKSGGLVAARRERPDLGPWRFEEIDLNLIHEVVAREKQASCVVVADKSLQSVRFQHLLRTIKDTVGAKVIWLRVWGAHPYPLEIEIDVTNLEELGRKLQGCNSLQEVVDRLSTRPPVVKKRKTKLGPGQTVAPNRS